MTPRMIVTSLLVAAALTAAPAFAIGGGPPVAGTSSGVSLDATASSNSGLSAIGAPAYSRAGASSCGESLRGFMGRNTLRPSVRRAALARCEADRTERDLKAVAR